MRLVRALAFFAILQWSFTGFRLEAREGDAFPAYETWKTACARLPANRGLQGRLPPKQLLPLRSYAEFQSVLSLYLEQTVNGALRHGSNWVGEVPAAGFFDTNRAYFLGPRSPGGGISFQPFAQKLTFPEGSEVFFRGDLHGDVHSLLANLDWLNEQKYLSGFAIQRTNFYMVFLGDYTDRGSHGIEVLYTILRLKIANPDRVFMVRGNHEEITMQARYGFLAEGKAKYGNDFDPTKLYRAYDFLPVVIYAGSAENFIQCNHGGMEPGYNPRVLIESDGGSRYQLLGKLNQKKFLQENPAWPGDARSGSRDLALRAFLDFTPEDPVTPTVLGFMWNDFSVLTSESQFTLDPGRAFVYGDQATRFILEQAGTSRRKVQAVFRAHQHSSVLNPMMRRLVASGGVFRHWQSTDSPALLNRPPSEVALKVETSAVRAIPTGSVWTFNVGPDSVYGEGCGFSFDTFGVLTTASRFEDWRLKRVNLEVKP